MISMIAVIGKNRELGNENHLLWKIPGDLPRFKQITWGHPVIMGRKTHSTFQYKGGPLPGRTNIVVTRNENFNAPGFTIVHSLNEALLKAKNSEGSNEIFIIGGGTMYSQTIGITHRLYLTVVDSLADADTFFPDYSHFTKIIATEMKHEGGYSYSYLILEK